MSGKTSASLSITTGLLLVYLVMASLPVAFGLVFLLFLTVAVFFLGMVLTILRDQTDPVKKKFDEQFYLDQLPE